MSFDSKGLAMWIVDFYHFICFWYTTCTILMVVVVWAGIKAGVITMVVKP